MESVQKFAFNWRHVDWIHRMLAGNATLTPPLELDPTKIAFTKHFWVHASSCLSYLCTSTPAFGTNFSPIHEIQHVAQFITWCKHARMKASCIHKKNSILNSIRAILAQSDSQLCHSKEALGNHIVRVLFSGTKNRGETESHSLTSRRHNFVKQIE